MEDWLWESEGMSVRSWKCVLDAKGGSAAASWPENMDNQEERSSQVSLADEASPGESLEY